MSSRRRQPTQSFTALFLATCCILGVTAFPSLGGAAELQSDGAKPSAGRSAGGPTGGSGPSKNQIDALTATREEVAQKVASLDAQYKAQQESVLAAEAAVAVANEGVDRARARVALAENEVELAQQTVQEYAIEAYIHPPAHDSLRIFSVDRAEDATYVNDLLKILTDERYKVVDVLIVKKRIAAMESELADKAAGEAAAQVEAAKAQLGSLNEIRQEQTDLVSSLDERLERALAEAAALEAIDKQVARELAEQELALHNTASLMSTSADRPLAVELTASTQNPAKASSNSSVSPAPPATSKQTNTTRPPRATQPPRVTTTTRPAPPVTPPPPSSGLVTWADVTNVGGGIWIHNSLASKVRRLLDAATAAGYSLTGGGYRDSAGQIATRRANCGPTYYDIYQKPSGQCRPPTAIPGRSMHEQGRAMDLKSNGSLITSRSNPAFVWLSNNASKYGFYNLPSEPWHWSTNGH